MATRNRIGIIGGGQLARMMGVPAMELGFQVTILDPEANSPAGQVVGSQIVANMEDPAALAQLGREANFITIESEMTHWHTLKSFGRKVNPSPQTLESTINKLKQKQLLESLAIPSAKFYEVRNKTDLIQAGDKLGYPVMLKAAINAYDGHGNFLINSPADIDLALEQLGGRSLYAEQFVPFIKELAVMVARGLSGEIKIYPVVETIHVNHICHLVLAPAPVPENTSKKAQELAKTAVSHLNGAGVFGVEMFLTKTGKVLINEIAPRVHNSGHYTIEACVTSQFEQHIRAITGLPLGITAMKVPAAVMINILGEHEGPVQLGGLNQALRLTNVSVNLYGKAQTRVGRKMGHITVVGDNLEECRKTAEAARKCITI